MAIVVPTTTSLSRHLKPDISKKIRSRLDRDGTLQTINRGKWQTRVSHLTVLNEKKGEASTREYSQNAISVLLGTFNHSIHCTPALYLLVFPVIYVVVTLHAQRELGKVIGLGVLIYSYMFVDQKNFELYFSDRLTFSNIRGTTSRRIYRLVLALLSLETLYSLSK